MKKLWTAQTEELLSGKFDCFCGREHFASIPIEANGSISEVLEGIIPKGARVLLFSSFCYRDFAKGLFKEVSDSGYTPTSFLYEEGEENPVPEIEEGVTLIIAIGGEEIMERAKLLSSAHDTLLVLIPSSFNFARFAKECSLLDYGGVRIIRPSRAPDKILFYPEAYACLTQDKFASAIGELFSKVITFCDYKFRAENEMSCCDGIIYSAMQSFKELSSLNYIRSNDCVKNIYPHALRINALLYMCGEEEGGESQIATCIERFTKTKGRAKRERGEILLASALLAGKIYDNFLTRDKLYSVLDGNASADKAIKVLSLNEREAVKGGVLEVEDYRFCEYKFELNKEGLASCVKEGNILLKKFFDIYRKTVSDACYNLRYYISVREMLDVLSCSPLYTRKKTLLGFIKERGILEFEKGGI